MEHPKSFAVILTMLKDLQLESEAPKEATVSAYLSSDMQPYASMLYHVIVAIQYRFRHYLMLSFLPFSVTSAVASSAETLWSLSTLQLVLTIGLLPWITSVPIGSRMAKSLNEVFNLAWCLRESIICFSHNLKNVSFWSLFKKYITIWSLGHRKDAICMSWKESKSPPSLAVLSIRARGWPGTLSVSSDMFKRISPSEQSIPIVRLSLKMLGNHVMNRCAVIQAFLFHLQTIGMVNSV